MADMHRPFVECDDARQAEDRAKDAAIDQHLDVVPVRLFSQAGRDMACGALPVRVLHRILRHTPAHKGTGVGDVGGFGNRPLDPGHVQTIKEYLKRATKERTKYIMPAVTVNADPNATQVYRARDRAVTTAWVVLPSEQGLSITDGQHRFKAIDAAVDELRLEGVAEVQAFELDSIPVVITWERDRDQIHQDFADAAKTKPLPPSLVAVFDLRHPANRAVLELCRSVPLLKGRVDGTSRTLSKNSAYLFLANQVRMFVKGRLTNNPTMDDLGFAKMADEQLADPSAFERWVGQTRTFLEILTELIPQWSEIAQLPTPRSGGGPEVGTRMRALRDEGWISLSAATLSVLGIVGYHVFKHLGSSYGLDLGERLRGLLKPLETIDWSRDARMWESNLVVAGAIKTQSGNLRRASEELLGRINLPATVSQDR